VIFLFSKSLWIESASCYGRLIDKLKSANAACRMSWAGGLHRDSSSSLCSFPLILIVITLLGVWTWDKFCLSLISLVDGWTAALVGFFSFKLINDQFGALTGFNEQRLVNAANRQLTTLPFYHSFWNRTSQPPLVKSLKHSYYNMIE